MTMFPDLFQFFNFNMLQFDSSRSLLLPLLANCPYVDRLTHRCERQTRQESCAAVLG